MKAIIEKVHKAYEKGKEQQTFSRETTREILATLMDNEAKIKDLEIQLMDCKARYNALKDAVIEHYKREAWK